uniref:Integrase n=1 Tax=Vibrio splendidus TaxID=29497 RepID=A0A0H3ZJP8_VIBSP|nr:hypothetical protein [Vibrio splendidus]
MHDAECYWKTLSNRKIGCDQIRTSTNTFLSILHARQNKMVSDAQTERNALATEIAHAAGLRAHELHTLQRLDERTPDPRPALEEKFSGREGERYTVEGKGGLIREVLIPKHFLND